MPTQLTKDLDTWVFFLLLGGTRTREEKGCEPLVYRIDSSYLADNDVVVRDGNSVSWWIVVKGTPVKVLKE